MKRCHYCHKQFDPDKSPGGTKSLCSERCREKERIYMRGYRLRKGDELKKKTRKRYLKKVSDPEYRLKLNANARERYKRYYQTRKELFVARRKRHYTKHRDLILEKNREKYKLNREKYRAMHKAWYEKNREKEKIKSKEYYQKNRARYRENFLKKYHENPSFFLERNKRYREARKLKLQKDS